MTIAPRPYAPGPDPAWQQVVSSAYGTLAKEVDTPIPIPLLEGRLPADLRGVLFRNGPGRQERGGVRYGHPFDGDGYVQRMVFGEEGVQWSGRFVRTAEWAAEEAADRILYRGFGTQKPGGVWANLLRMRFKNAANTSIVQHGGKTLALWEGGLPHEVDPSTLETLGPHDFDGVLRNRGIEGLVAPVRPFSAHPSVCPETGDLYNFGTAYGIKNRLLIYRVDPEGVCHTREIELEALPFVHDMALTRRFVVLMTPAVCFDIASALLGVKSPVQSLSLESAPGTLWLIPRDGGEPIHLPVSPGFVFHWGAAWEGRDHGLDGDPIVLEGVKYDAFPRLDAMGDVMAQGESLLAYMVRWTVDLDTGTVKEERVHDLPVELPTSIGEGPERVVFATGAPPTRRQPYLSALVRHGPEGVSMRDLTPDLPGEPMVCGDWLVVQVWMARTSSTEVWVVDPNTLETVARLGVPVPVPPALHGAWLPAA